MKTAFCFPGQGSQTVGMGVAFADAPPVRSTVVSGLVMPGAKVEIEVIAYAPAAAS